MQYEFLLITSTHLTEALRVARCAREHPSSVASARLTEWKVLVARRATIALLPSETLTTLTGSCEL